MDLGLIGSSNTRMNKILFWPGRISVKRMRQVKVKICKDGEEVHDNLTEERKIVTLFWKRGS